jgi:hypothetical protein
LARTFGSGQFGSGSIGGSTTAAQLPSYGVSIYGVDSYGSRTVLVVTPTITATGISTVSLSWVTNGGIAPFTYAVQMATGNNPGGPYNTVVSGLTNTTYTVSGLKSSFTYWFQVVATDSGVPTPTTTTSSGVPATTQVAPPVPTVLPSVICELSLTDPTLGPAWTDITPYLKSFSVKRGRNFELDRTEAGTATVVLDNSDGRFEPLNPYGAYYGSLKRYRRVRLRAFWAGSFYPIFNGFITQLPETILGLANAEASISLSDGFVALSQCLLSSTYAVEKSDVRIGHVLDDALWTTGSAWTLGDQFLGALGISTVLGPAGDRQVDPGQALLDTITLNNTSALQHIQDVQATEDGWIFVSADGTFVFYSRNRRTAQSNLSTMQTFGDRPGSQELMYVNVVLNDDVPIYNTVQVTRSATGSVPQKAQDNASRSSYFVQSLQLQSLVTDDATATAMANYYVNRYKEPKQRIATLVLDGTGDPQKLWPQILGREIADPVTVRVRPPVTPWGSVTIEQPSWIEGIEHTWTAEGGEWTTQWHLSPIDLPKYWVLGTSVLGTSTTLGIF